MSTDQRHRSRAFLYGESVFTTLRVEQGRPYFYKAHQNRLLKCAEWLWPGTASQAQALWDELSVPEGDGVWRITLYAEQTNRGLRISDEVTLDIDSWWHNELPKDQDWQSQCVPAASRPEQWPSFFKSSDYLSRLVSARHLPAGDIPLFTIEGEVAEFLHANFFGFDGKKFVTPPAGPNVLEGIGRSRFLDLVSNVEQRVIEVSELESFSSILAVNAVRGIIPLSSIDGRQLQRHALFEKLQSAFFV